MQKRFSLIILIVILLGFSTLSSGATFDAAEYEARRTKLMTFIPDGIAIIFGSDCDVMKTYGPWKDFKGKRQNSNFIYFTGVEETNSVLVIDGMKKESIIFFFSVESKERVMRETGIERVLPLSQFPQLLSSYNAQTDFIYTPDPKWDADRKRMKNGTPLKRIGDMFPSFRFKDLSAAIGKLRAIKSPAEIKVMREAARITSLAHIEVLKAVKPGMYEWELAAIFEDCVKRLGGQGHAANAIVPSGPNIDNPHYIKNSRKMEDGDIVMADMCGEYEYYDIDVAVSFPVNGKFNARQRKLNEIVCAVEEAMRSVFRPGIRSIDVKEEVRKIVAKKGIDMDKEGVYRILADHWVGLDVHDVSPSQERYPRTTILQPGMVITSDPSIRIKDENGIVIDGNKIENTVLITEDGCENLSYLVPRTIEEIEKIMAEK